MSKVKDLPNLVEVENPLVGSKLKDIRSTAPFTEILVVKNQVFEKFISPKTSIFRGVYEKPFRDLLETELGLKVASSADAASLISQFRI